MENKKLKNTLRITFAVIVLLLLIKITVSAKTIKGSAPFIVDFRGSAISSDPTVSYFWDFGDGATSNEQNPIHTYQAAGVYNAVLTVTNSAGKSSTDTIVVVVSAANDPPIADAGDDKSSAVNSITQLDGSGSTDQEGAQLSYNWVQTSGPYTVALSSTTAQKPSFTAIQEGTYEFQLTVYDGELYSSPDIVIITITPPNNPPEISNVQVTPMASTSGTLFEIMATVVDPTESGVSVVADVHSPELADNLVLTNQGGNEYMYIWDSVGVPPGTHTAEVTATSNQPVLSSTGSAPFSINPEAAACTIATSCAADQICIFSMSAETNAHAAQSCDSYSYKVCCPNSMFTSNSCGTAILKLPTASNAHVAQTDAAPALYTTSICISPNTIQCSYKDVCNTDEICVASYSSLYNAHVAKCDGNGYYTKKICCK